MAVFSSLTEKLQSVFDQIRRKGRLSEEDVRLALREVQVALLEADVNYRSVKTLVSRISEKAVGETVLESLSPAQQVIKIVFEELTEMMGGVSDGIRLQPEPPTVILLCGLQGTGKTTTCAKLARYFRKQNRSVLMAACDVQRPAAVRQLQVLGETLDIPVFAMEGETDPAVIAGESLAEARRSFSDILLVDTAGRLHLDREMMEQIRTVREILSPHETLLTVDAMTGQDALEAASAFHAEIPIDGLVLTKADGDARGGALIAVRDVTGKPVKFVGTGEKLENLEPFHPDRMARRILGMGDVLGLIDKAQSQFDEKQAQILEEKFRKTSFTLEDFLEQMDQMQNMGSLEEIAGMLPGMNRQMRNLQVDEKDMGRNRAIIQSMTRRERNHPDIINASRKKRIARGSGTSVQDVNRLLRQFSESQKFMKKIGQMGKGGKMPRIPGLFS